MPGSVSGRTIFLHIGTENTGTTTIQAVASSNRALLEQAGICYPRFPGKSGHAGLTLYAMQRIDKAGGLRALLGIGDRDRARAFLDNFIPSLLEEVDASGCAEVLLSNEHLSSRVKAEAQIRHLVDGLREIGDAIKVFIYLRPQYELLGSSYSTAVKSGGTARIDLQKYLHKPLFDYDAVLARWESVVGFENMSVRRFARTRFVGGDLIQDFFHALGRTVPAGLVIPPEKNARLDTDRLEFLRVANHYLPRLDGGNVNSDRTGLASALARLELGTPQGPRGHIPAAFCAEIEAAFADSNARVAARYFPGADETLFPAFTPEEAAPRREFDIDRAVEIGLALWIDKRRRVRARRKGRGLSDVSEIEED
jgi:hypothetical protein